MSRRNESTEFLLECMSDALVSLMKSKDFSKITINEITEKSGVSRITYFRHFHSKEEMLSYKIQRLWERWADNHNLSVRSGFDAENSTSFFEFNYANRELIQLLAKNNLSDVILDTFRNVFHISSLNGDELYSLSFYGYGLFGILMAWVYSNFEKSPKEMGELGKRLVRR